MIHLYLKLRDLSIVFKRRQKRKKEKITFALVNFIYLPCMLFPYSTLGAFYFLNVSKYVPSGLLDTARDIDHTSFYQDPNTMLKTISAY